MQTKEQNPPAGTSTIDATLITVDTGSDCFTVGEKHLGEMGVTLVITSGLICTAFALSENSDIVIGVSPRATGTISITPPNTQMPAVTVLDKQLLPLLTPVI